MYILENYWAVCFGVAPYIDRETHIFPKCTNNRGLHMVSLQHNMSRTEFIPFWNHVEAGTHLDLTCPFMDHQKVHRAEVNKYLCEGISFLIHFRMSGDFQHVQIHLIHLRSKTIRTRFMQNLLLCEKNILIHFKFHSLGSSLETQDSKFDQIHIFEMDQSYVFCNVM